MRVEAAVREQAALGEGPTWDTAARRLIWVDILGSRIHTYDPASGRRTVMATEQHVGAAKPRAGGGLVANLRDGIGLYEPGPGADGGTGTGHGGAFSWLFRDPAPGRRGNDAAVAPDGALWAGTMRDDEASGGGSLSRIAPAGTGGEISRTVVFPEVAVSNGLGWSPDGSLMYYIDSPTRRVDVCRVEDGLPVDRRPFVTIEPHGGFPDGLTVDAEGAVWVALWDGGQVRRYAPHGALERVIELPVRRPTACAFGGEQLRDLYITTARTGLHQPHPLSGSLLVVPDAGQGLPGTPYRG
ncbi:SMP-30/gluconolactonase/LRE family protein [Streptomyces sp. N2-109]|uniref:SMP-30/gluconolactonase/LRE family protein n=1 Tax=Streptomyces gossypii TaxID=2883101 RepID=A0ABT2JYY1_9ACTN|nr:SMP-30/gluconolactonase/LRE family protein [Streptomyces gossypii]MCT2593112.1 SMP-30/gluconolactonase/LRE family protein [Streptomyces gossypii]